MSQGYEALRHGAAFLDVSARGRIVVRGRDRVRLLHNLTTADVKKMTPGDCWYAFLLNPQGRIQADLDLFCFDDHFLISTEPELREKVQQYIRRYIIADQVELEDVSAEMSEVALEGPGAAEIIIESTDGIKRSPVPPGVSLTGQPGVRIFGGGSDIASRLVAAGAIPATHADFRQVRIENGKPRYGEDIRETTLPQETQQMRALSFSKGCYLGQEIVERIRAQGHVNKKLVRFEMEGNEVPASGAKLSANSAEAGEITTAIYSPERGKVVGMAYVRTAHADPGKVLQHGGNRAIVI